MDSFFYPDLTYTLCFKLEIYLKNGGGVGGEGGREEKIGQI